MKLKATVALLVVIFVPIQFLPAASDKEQARFLAAVKVAFQKHDADALVALTCWDRVADNLKADGKQQYIRYVAETATEIVLANADTKSPDAKSDDEKGVAYCSNLPVLKELKIKFGSGGQLNNGALPVGEKNGKLYLVEPALVEGLVVIGTMKQIIGTFMTYGQVKVGDTFELNLTHLPKERIDLARPRFDPKREVAAYVPFSSPLVLEKVKPPSTGYGTIRLSAIDVSGVNSKLIIQIYALKFRKGSKASVWIYEESFGDIDCMAEAEGVLK